MAGAKELNELLIALRQAFESGNVMKMRKLSNSAAKRAAISDDATIVAIALVGYCLHKMSTKQHIVISKKWQGIQQGIISQIDKAVEALEENNLPKFEKILEGIASSIKKHDHQLGNYVQDIYDKARVKYASTAYSLGLSLSQAAALTGANKKDLLHYIGATRLHDRDVVTLDIEKRLEKLRKSLGE